MIDIELDNAISAAMHAGGTSGTGLDPLPSAGNLLSAAEGGDGGGGNAFALDGIQNSNASYPEAFRVVADNPNGTSFHVNRPVVCDGTNVIEATGGTGLAGGDYYCRIDRDSSGTVTATIQDSSDAEDDTILIVPIATIDSTGIKQHHLGVIVLPPGGGSGEPIRSAFELEVTESSAGTKTGKIVRCNFIFDGEYKSLPDFSVSGSGPVYLVAKQPSPSGGMGDLPWTFEISESKGEAEEGGRVVNYKLYDLNGFAVTCDYRTTFMELKSPHHVSKFTVSKYAEPQSSVVIEACQDTEAKVSVSDGKASSIMEVANGEASLEMTQGSDGRVQARLKDSTAVLHAQTGRLRYATIFDIGSSAGITLVHDGKQIDVRTTGIRHGSVMGIHVLRIKDINGSVLDEYDVISTADIEIIKAQGTVLKDISLQYTNYELQMTKTKVDLATGQETTEGPSRVFPTELHSAQS